jgi:anti-sigma regulatory factor (Ser/Thr protein kinase)
MRAIKRGGAPDLWGTMRVELHFPPAPASVRRAREAVSSALDGRVPAEVERDVVLLVSEVVATSVRHARPEAEGQIGLVVSVLDDRIRVEVSDGGPGFDPEVRPSREGPSGWGLYLVDYLADTWGIGRDATNVLWFEFDVERSPRVPA